MELALSWNGDSCALLMKQNRLDWLQTYNRELWITLTTKEEAVTKYSGTALTILSRVSRYSFTSSLGDIWRRIPFFYSNVKFDVIFERSTKKLQGNNSVTGKFRGN